MVRFLGAALALLLATDNLPKSNADSYVCGSDYTDATQNCTTNQQCPSGDGCPAEKAICFVVPTAACFIPPPPPPTVTPSREPSSSPTSPPLRVCGSNYPDALASCRTNDTCPGGDTDLCTDPTHACFSIPAATCDAQPTVAPTMSPTPMPRVCGTSSFDAQAKCGNGDPSRACPSGDGCDPGEACFGVPQSLCGVTLGPTDRPTGKPTVMEEVVLVDPVPVDDVEQLATTTPSPTMPPVESDWQVCGVNYGDATANCRVNTRCPSGDVSCSCCIPSLFCSRCLVRCSIFQKCSMQK